MTSLGKKKKNAFKSISAAASSFHVEIDRVGRGMALLINGVNGVAEFSSQCVTLLTCGMRMIIRGEGLCITVYENKSVEIVGTIGGIEYSYGKN